ncbi:MAG TPA: signal peptidase I [Candidatus Faecisoma merdavium]|nr:signal peptidase I [Candidatus Faecisoma merdavium]
MKKGYKKLLIFQLILLVIFIFNSFVSSILTKYNQIIFLIIILIFFKFLFGFEKDRHRYIKDLILETIIFLLTYFIIFYLSGIIIGFAKTTNYYTLSGFIDFIIPLVLSIILKEYLRYMMLTKSEYCKLLNVTTVILFIIFDVSNAIFYNSFSNNYDSFMFISLTLLPAIGNNIVCSYISRSSGYKPVILYLLCINLYQYLLPIIPNPNEYLLSVINLLVPFSYGFSIYRFYSRVKDEDILRDYNKKKINSLIPALIISIIAVYFTSGYFKYYMVAIASGSMTPNINKGDVVIIEKTNNYEEIEVGQVMAYKYNNVIVVHRVIRKINDDGSYYFYTKGDNNPDEDNYPIKEDMVIGVVDVKIPYIGIPTVWLNNL